jgi:hypothetical protein
MGTPLKELATILAEKINSAGSSIFENATVGDTIAWDWIRRCATSTARHGDFVLGAEFVDGTGALAKRWAGSQECDRL